MPVSFLALALDRAGGAQLEMHFQSCDYLHSRIRREGYFTTIQPIADRIKNFTVHITPTLGPHWEGYHLPKLFSVPYPSLESLDLSYNPFYASYSRRNQQPHRPGIGPDAKGAAMLELLTLIPTSQLKHLTLRHVEGWPPTYFGNLTNLTLFGCADGTALAEAVTANPALQKLKLESIKHKERFSYDPRRLVELDGQTLELARCDPGVLSMFTLTSTCSLVITQTMDQNAIAYKAKIAALWWLPEDISGIRCLQELAEVRFSVVRTPGRKGWIAAEQKTVGYSTSNLTPGSGPGPSVTFNLTYHSDARAQLHEVPFEPKYLLPYPTPWGQVTRASFDGFSGQFRIRDDAVLKTLPSLRSMMLRRCDSGYLVRLITPDKLQGLESLWFEDELSGADFGDTLSKTFELRHTFAGLRLKDLKIVIPGDPSSIITAEQMERLEGCIYRIEATKAPGYRSVALIKYN